MYYIKPYFQNRLRLANQRICSGPEYDRCQDWCKENCIDEFFTRFVADENHDDHDDSRFQCWSFKNKNDATLFALMWGSK